MVRTSRWVAAVLVSGRSEVLVPGEAGEADGKVPEGGRSTGRVAGPDVGSVIVVGDISDVVPASTPQFPQVIRAVERHRRGGRGAGDADFGIAVGFAQPWVHRIHPQTPRLKDNSEFDAYGACHVTRKGECLCQACRNP